MVHAADRDAAIDRLRRALDETEIAGIQTTLPFDRFVARHPGFRAGDLSIEWVAESWDGAADRASHAGVAAEAAARAIAGRSVRRALATARSFVGGYPPGPSGRDRLGRRRPRRRDRSVAGVTRLRVTDRATGEVLGDVEASAAADGTELRARRPGDRPARPRARRRPVAGPRSRSSSTAGASSLEVEDAGLADLRERATASREAAIHHGPTEVRAIIPGRVVSVAVEAGDAVVAGQRLLAVEAMKMENELRSPRAGTVDRVATAVGQTVELGDPLVVIR